MLRKQDNKMKIRYIKAIILFFSVSCFLACGSKPRFASEGTPSDPPSLYLTWRKDPSSTMTIQWITPKNNKNDTVYYRRLKGSKIKKSIGKSHPFPHAAYSIHVNEITHLKEDTEYLFGFDKKSLHFKFRTMPSNNKRPIKFIIGGDTYHKREMLRLANKQAAKQDPMFVVIGGDFAYSSSKFVSKREEGTQRWLNWLEEWKQHMVAPDGRLIPLLPAIGNHEVIGAHNQTPKEAEEFYSLFSIMPGEQGYNVLDFGDYMSLFLLDSGHTHPIEGEQKRWLEESLSSRRHVPHRFVVYHVPAYPSVRPFDHKTSKKIRKHWSPIFDAYRISAAFEHHEHNYKRSRLILGGEIHPKGTLYLGDGGWGSEVKTTRVGSRWYREKPDLRWYLEKTIAANNFFLVEIHRKNRRFVGIHSRKGEILDEYFSSEK